MHFRIGQWQMWNSARVCALWVWLSPLCLATLAGEPPPRPADVFKPIAMSELPDFKAELEEKATKKGLVHTNGLVATINYKEFKEPKVEGAVKIKLPAASTGFKGEMEVCALWQPGKAPLAIPLLGIYEEHDDKLVRAWQAYLFEAGCHVVTFDSPFRNDFNSRSVHGVVGNLEEDAKVAARLIEALLDYRDAPGAPPLRENVTCLRLLGTSYGGFLALHMVRQERAKLGPIDRVLILSAPVKMSTALHTIDQFHEVDRARFQTSLIKLMGGYTPDKPDPSERELSLMRAGIGYDFYDTLDSILKHNEETYMPGLFDKFKAEEEALVQKEKFEARENELKTKQEQEALALERKYQGHVELKEEYKAKKRELRERHDVERNLVRRKWSDRGCWTFKDYVHRICAPYWKLKPEELLVKGNLDDLLVNSPGYVQAVLAADDPLNKADELEALRKRIPAPKLLVLPHGGHLGFAGTQWTKALVVKFFKAP